MIPSKERRFIIGHECEGSRYMMRILGKEKGVSKMRIIRDFVPLAASQDRNTVLFGAANGRSEIRV